MQSALLGSLTATQAPISVVLVVLRKGATMILAIQHAVHVFANLVVASTMGLSLAIGVAGVFQQRPLDCAACHAAQPTLAAAKPHGVVVASVR